MISYNAPAYRRPSLPRLAASVFLVATIAVITAHPANAQNPNAQDYHLADSLEHLAATTNGLLGVAVTYAGTGETTLLHGHDHYPMMSVFKFPLALYILDQADKKKLSLDEPVTIHKKTWSRIFSPMLNSSPGKTVRLTIRDLTANIILLSDNVACDVLLGRIGGPEVLNNYIHALGIDEINIAWAEAQMAADPVAAAHKTGTSNTDPTGLTAATNDVGILTLPGSAHLYITVFLTDSHADEATRENVIALVGRLAANTYSRIP